MPTSRHCLYRVKVNQRMLKVKELVYTTPVRTEKSRGRERGVKDPHLHIHAITTRIAARTFIRVYDAALLRQKSASKVLENVAIRACDLVIKGACYPAADGKVAKKNITLPLKYLLSIRCRTQTALFHSLSRRGFI